MNTILALELSKFKSVACLYDPATAQAHFDNLTTCRAELLRLFQRRCPGVVAIEASTLAAWAHDLCQEHGARYKVADTADEPGCSSTPGTRPTRTTPSA
jgi:hypothetical protein